MSATDTSERVCLYCGGSLAGLRADARYCSTPHRSAHSKLRRLAEGIVVDGYDSPQAFASRRVRARSGSARDASQSRSQVGDKRRGKPRLDTRTSRAEKWIADRVRENPGHVTRARRLYSAYSTWAAQHDPDGPLRYSAFLKVVDRSAPIEGIVHLVADRGRPQLAFLGIVLTAVRR